MALGISRRLRGVFGVAATWAIAFGGFGTVMSVLAALIAAAVGAMPMSILAGVPLSEWIAGMLRWVLLGGVSGTAFAAAVIRNGSGRTIDDLSSRRFALWGAGAGAVGSAAVMAATLAAFELSGRLPAGQIPLAVIASGVCGLGVLGGGLGAAMASATLRAARQAPVAAADPLEQAGVGVN